MSSVSGGVCLGVLTLLAYWRVWSLPFVYDDTTFLVDAAGLASWPVRLGLWWSDGLPYGPHAVTLLLHLWNGCLLWLIARRWLSVPAAGLAVSLLLLHPLPAQAVVYITAGREVWLTTLVLLAAVAWLTGRWWRLLSVPLLLCAVSIKPSAWPILVVLPLLLAWRAGYGRLAVVVMVLVAGSVSGLAYSVEGWQRWGMALWRYLLFVPVPYGFSIIHDWAAVPAWVGTAAVIWTGILGMWAWHAGGGWWGGWIWVVGLTVPRAVVTDAPTLTEWQMYLPCVAVWLLCGVLLDNVLHKESVWLIRVKRLTSTTLPSPSPAG